MVREFIHCCSQRWRLHPAHIAEHGFHEFPAVLIQGILPHIAVFLHPCEEPGKRLHKRIIIHHSIPLIAFQPRRRVPVMFGNNEGFRIRRFYCAPEIAPEAVVCLLRMPQISRHIQPPAVNAVRRLKPFFSNPEYILAQLVRALIIQLGKRGMIPPSLIGFVIRPAIFI